MVSLETNSAEKTDLNGTELPLNIFIKVETQFLQTVSSLLSIEESSGSQQVAMMELLYPMIDNSSGTEIPCSLAYFIAPTAKLSSAVMIELKVRPFFLNLLRNLWFREYHQQNTAHVNH